MKKVIAFLMGILATLLIAGCSIQSEIEWYYPGKNETTNRRIYHDRPGQVNPSNLALFEAWRESEGK